jgi:hypothetical protein
LAKPESRVAWKRLESRRSGNLVKTMPLLENWTLELVVSYTRYIGPYR